MWVNWYGALPSNPTYPCEYQCYCAFPVHLCQLPPGLPIHTGTVLRPAAAAYTSHRPVTYHGERRGSTTFPIAYYAHVWNINKKLVEVWLTETRPRNK